MTDGAATALLAPPVNVARLLLHPDGVAPRIVNLDEWAWHILDRLRDEAVRNPDARLDALLAELEALVGDRPRAAGPGTSASRSRSGCAAPRASSTS